MPEHYDDYEELDLTLDRKPRSLADDPAMRMLLPVGRSAWAIAAGYLGLLSVLCIPSPIALFAGIMAVREINRDPSKHGMGRAVFGIIMGSIGLVFLVIYVIVGIVAATSAPPP